VCVNISNGTVAPVGTLSIQGDYTQTGAVDGARAWSDALKVDAGSLLALNQYTSLFASFDGEFANSAIATRRGGVRFSW
jgi:hypothetical protein